MLMRLKLTNFRKHRDTELMLQHGLTVLRGNNEAGKSTLIEAICYALFGVKALRSSIDEAVTHDEPVNTLRVELVVMIDGVEYSVRRGKSGAEVNYDGGRVTGQSEVTNFLCAKLRIDPASAAKLMLASQNEIRGALEAGPKATAELIERLAEFDQIDLLVERMQERLSLGSTTAAQEQLAKTEQTLAETPEPVEPDYAGMTAHVEALKAQHAQARADAEALESEFLQAQAFLDTARAAEARHKQAELALGQAVARLQEHTKALGAAQEQANKVWVWPKTESELRAEIAQLEAAGETLRIWQRVKPALTPPPVQVEASVQEVLAEIATLEAQAAGASDKGHKARTRAALAKGQISVGTCSFCGQDFSHLPEVARKNASLQEAVDSGEAEAEEMARVEAAARSEVRELQALLVEARARGALLESFPAYVRALDGADLPHTLEWIGPDIASLQDVGPELTKVRKDLADLQAAEKAHAQAVTRFETLAAARGPLVVDVDAARLALETAAVRPDVAEAVAALEAVLARRRPLEQRASDLMVAIRDAEYTLRDAKRVHQEAVARRQQMVDMVTALKGQIKATEFNNTLLKRVRQCRPLIADQLWNIVLSAVSGYFSEMRGQKSTVTKDSDGFKVDGHGVASLSGSTLDILGLAIRVALVRTFLPNAPFMVLDEPCAAMDSQRTEATLGFIVACGFRQVIVVTHEDTSETVADRLIQLTE